MSKAAVCRNFGVKRITLIETLARIGWPKLLKSDVEFEVVLVNATETPCERPQKFRIIAERYRNRRKRYELRITLIAAIHNFELG